MRLDTERLLREAEQYNFARLSDSEGAVRTSARFSESLRESGWQVRSIPVKYGIAAGRVGQAAAAVLWLAASGAGLWFLLRRSLGRPWRWSTATLAVVTFAALVGLVLYYVTRRRLSFVRQSSARPATAVAMWGETGAAASRVVLTTTLFDIGDWPWLQYGGMVAVLGFGMAMLAYQTDRAALLILAWAFVLSNVLFGLSTLVLAFTGGRPMSGYNRTGVALAAELARTLPATLRGRVDLRIVGFGHPEIPPQRLLADWPAKPTLWLYLDCPGMSPEVDIRCSRRGLEIACNAARDLWLPHHCRASRASWRDKADEASVWLCGSWRSSTIDPKALTAAAQLVEELALRWAKANQDDRTAARSSQNPG